MKKENEVIYQSTQIIIDAARKRGMKVIVISRPFHLVKLMYGGKTWFVKGTSFPVNPQPACQIANNKFLTKEVLRNERVPVPRGWLVRTPKAAKLIVSQHNLLPCVVKPVRGAHGNRVFTNIETLKELEKILPFVFPDDKQEDVIVEEFINGKDYRVLVVGNKVVAAIERIPAHVIGDGSSSIRQLIKMFNQNPLVGRGYEKPLCKIRINNEVKRILKKQGKRLEYIPKNKEKVYLRQNANISTGGISKDVTDDISDKLKELAIRATKVIGMVISGVDIIYNEDTKQAYILELNVCSGIDIHHFPIQGKPRAVADDIIDFLIKYKK